MAFQLTLNSSKDKITLTGVAENGEEVKLRATPLAFTPWSIVFRDFLRLLYWAPHSETEAQSIWNSFKEPFVFPDEVGFETHFRVEPLQTDESIKSNLLVWQPSAINQSAFSIQEEAALLFLNVLALGLAKREDENFSADSEEATREELFQFHKETRRIEDPFRATGLSPFWVTPEIQRILIVARALDLGLRLPDDMPAPLLRAAEEKALSTWRKEDFEILIRLLSHLEYQWNQSYHQTPKDSGEAVWALGNWVFAMNLLGFIDRFLAGTLPTRMPNPTAPLLNFLLERYFITQWESNLWPARRSALEETYQKLISLLLD